MKDSSIRRKNRERKFKWIGWSIIIQLHQKSNHTGAPINEKPIKFLEKPFKKNSGLTWYEFELSSQPNHFHARITNRQI